MTDALKPRFEVVSIAEKNQHYIHDREYGAPDWEPGKPGNALAVCWFEEQAKQIVDALNRATPPSRTAEEVFVQSCGCIPTDLGLQCAQITEKEYEAEKAHADMLAAALKKADSAAKWYSDGEYGDRHKVEKALAAHAKRREG